MRERERFVLTAISLGFFLWIIQLIPISWRYLGIAGFTLLTYLTSAWTLRKYLKFHHWLIFAGKLHKQLARRQISGA